MSKAFKDFNATIGATREVVDEEFGHPEIGPFVLKGWVNDFISVEKYFLLDKIK